MKRLRVLHIVDSLGVGGLEKGIVTLARNASDDIEHCIICLRRSGPFAKLLPPSVKVIALNKPEGNSLHFLRCLTREIKHQAPEVVHTRNWGGIDGVIASLAAGIRNIAHGEHGWDLLDPYGQSCKRRLIRRFLSLGISEFSCVSAQIKEWLETKVRVCRPVTQIYNGVDTEYFTPRNCHNVLRRELGLSDSAFLIGIVARLEPIKDHHTLLKAFSQFRSRSENIHLVIVGDGSLKSSLEAHGGDRVHFLGSRSDVNVLLRGLDLFVLSSLNEGISNTILEAMASGVPVVASRVGGNPELVRNGIDGFLFPPGDCESLTYFFNKFWINPALRHQHGVNARARVLSQFSIPAMVSQYEDLWRRIAKRCVG